MVYELNEVWRTTLDEFIDYESRWAVQNGREIKLTTAIEKGYRKYRVKIYMTDSFNNTIILNHLWTHQRTRAERTQTELMRKFANLVKI